MNDDLDKKLKICEFLNKRKQQEKNEKQMKFSNYIEENYNFFTYGISQASLAILNSMLDSELISCEIRPFPLKLMLLQVCEETALNELEISLWVLIIENCILYTGSTCLYADFLYSALSSKEHLNSNINFLLEKYTKKDKNFMNSYSNWCLSNKYTFTCANICKRYSQGMKYRSSGINLNFYVDEILMNSLQYEMKKSKEKKRDETNIVELPGLARFNSLEVVYEFNQNSSKEREKKDDTDVNEQPGLARFNSFEPVSDLYRNFSEDSLQILPLGIRTSSNSFSMKCSTCSVCTQYLSFDL